jgi:hypothetical protein
VLVGGSASHVVERAARCGDGWTVGASGAAGLADGAARLRAAWRRHGRLGAPRVAALFYHSLVEHAEAHAQSSLRGYYGWLGAKIAGRIADGAATTPDAVQATAAALAVAIATDVVAMHAGSASSRSICWPAALGVRTASPVATGIRQELAALRGAARSR